MGAFDWASPLLTVLGNLRVAIQEALPAGGNLIGKVDPAVSAPQLFAVTMTLANTEYSQAMPTNCRRFELQCRTANDIRIAYVTGKVAAPTDPYWTLKATRADDSGPIAQGASPSTIYFACSVAAQVVEIRAWV